MYQLLLADILKFTKNVFSKNFTFRIYCDRCSGKKCSISCIFQTIIVIVVIKLLKKFYEEVQLSKGMFRNSVIVCLLNINRILEQLF